ncbi:MAG: diguanylate cyclase domain-containing protein [Roseateles sp.]
MGSRLAAAQRGERALLLILDIDRFGFFNDTLGHEAGDKLLDAIGERISHCFWRRSPASRRSTLVGTWARTPSPSSSRRRGRATPCGRRWPSWPARCASRSASRTGG